MYFEKNEVKNVIRIISVLKAYYGNNAYYVRIKIVLDKTFALIIFPVLPSYKTDRWVVPWYDRKNGWGTIS